MGSGKLLNNMESKTARWIGDMTVAGEIEQSEYVDAKARELAEDEELMTMLRTALDGTKNKKYGYPKSVPIELLLTLRKKKLPIKAIARICKRSPSTIRERLKKAGAHEINFIDEWKKNRADILALQQRRILNSITDKDLMDASLREKSMSFGIMYDKERLETGKTLGDGKFVVMLVNYAENPADSVSPGSTNPHIINITPK